MIQPKEFERWLREGEGPRVDFKHGITSLPKIAKSMVAYANSRGGYIVVGVDDNKDILGTKIEQEKFQLQEANKHYCINEVELDFEVLSYRGHSILIAHIAESFNKPHYASDINGQRKLYIRIADECVVADPLFEQYIISGAFNYPYRNTAAQNKVIQKVKELLDSEARVSINDYSQLSGLDRDQSIKRLLNLVLEGVLKWDAKTESLSLNKSYFKWNSI